MTSRGLVTTSAIPGSSPASTAVATVHHDDVLVEDVEPGLARRRVVAGGDDEDVFPVDLVEAAAAYFDL